MVNRVLLALISFALGGAVVWVVRPRSDGGEAPPVRTPVPPANPVVVVVPVEPAPDPTPFARPVPDAIDPDDVEVLGEASTADTFWIDHKRELDDLIAKMNWCGTGASEGGLVSLPPPTPPSRTPRVSRSFAFDGLDLAGDDTFRRLVDELEGARKPSQHRKLIRAFLVERAATASTQDLRRVILALMTWEPFPVVTARLREVSVALATGASWEKAFDEYRRRVIVELPPPPKDH